MVTIQVCVHVLFIVLTTIGALLFPHFVVSTRRRSQLCVVLNILLFVATRWCLHEIPWHLRHVSDETTHFGMDVIHHT